ncbi:hypothetical protein [Pelagicoccus mobilis]|uniref:Uncharacterized protein n=1 Tax=Pelagicoccus mobilis TaxID=415221 RepID=A0A934VPT0_9BACT|nr:hypothetical protein [Pelagicoccus mobilis]MBK1877612.1 hypothetical protein [Pelagicoccus mobilis]
MKYTTAALTLLSACLTSFAQASQQDFEAAPTIPAEQILSSYEMQTEYHSVGPEVKVKDYGYTFSLKTKQGEADIWSRDLLDERIRETIAIDALNEVSQTEAFTNALTQALKNPVAGAWQVATQPVSTVKKLPGRSYRYFKGTFFGVKKTSTQATETVNETVKKNTGKSDEPKEPIQQQATQAASGASKELLGFNKAKRAWAKKLNVNPYSDNPYLMETLDRVAWASSFGSLVVDVAVPSLGPLGYVNDVQNIVWDTPSVELELQNDERLKKAEIDKKVVHDFHTNPIYLLNEKTEIALATEAFIGAEGLDQLIDITLAAEDRFDARMMVKVTRILNHYHHTQAPLKSIEIKRGMLAAYDQNGALILPVAVEYLHWTSDVQEAAEDESFASENRQLWVTGELTEKTQEQLNKRGWKFVENSLQQLEE